MERNMKKCKFLNLKVYINKNTKQKTIVLPSKEIKKLGKKLPKMVKVSW